MRKRLIVALASVGAFCMFFAFAGIASASGKSGPREGSDGNNVVCNGVPSKAMLMYYARGGTDSCGHHDIASIWESQGITPQVASLMHAGQVCSSQGLQSTGRHHGPNPALDRAVTVNGTTFYVRPLAVWGSTCYSAWVGTTEDGRLVAILMGCGNSEVTQEVPTKPNTPAIKPKKTASGSLTVCKSVPGGANASFRFRATDMVNGKSFYFRLRPGECKTVHFPLNDRIRVHENPAKGWVKMTDRVVKVGKKSKITFVNRRIVVKTTPTTPPGNCNIVIIGNNNNASACNVSIQITCSGVSIVFSGPDSDSVNKAITQYTSTHNCNTETPPASPTYNCTGLALVSQNLTATATISVSTTGGASFKSATINWGDNASTPPAGLVQQHTYGAAGNYTVNATVTFNLPNSTTTSATCSGMVSISTPPSNVAPSCSGVSSPQNGPNGLYADGEMFPGKVTITDKSGDPLVVTFSSTYGSFANGPISFTSSGVDVENWTFVAPNDTAVVGKTDQIMVKVTNTKTGASGTCSSQPFVYNASPTQV